MGTLFGLPLMYFEIFITMYCICVYQTQNQTLHGPGFNCDSPRLLCTKKKSPTWICIKENVMGLLTFTCVCKITLLTISVNFRENNTEFC